MVYGPRDWVEITLGVQASAGGHFSEFGDAATTGYLILDFFF
jgi:hypothetical protein